MGSNLPVISGYGDLVFIGRGGFASVYRARQLAFDRDVALKVIDQGHSDGRDAEQFTRECRAIGSLSWHPHVVPVHDAGRTDDGASYLAMELLPGGSLADAVAGGPMAAGDVVRHGHDVADALAAAHEIGVLHRDVKPANILLDRRGRARLADFGIARMAGAAATTTGAVTGTIAYLAPEVLAGAKASAASDVYALGVTLATLLDGRNPYVQETDDSPFAVVTRVLSDQAPELSGAVPASVAALVMACVARAPEDRPRSATEVQEALATIDLAPPSAPTVPHRAPPPVPTTSWSPSRPITPPPAPGPDPRPVPPPPPSTLRPHDDATTSLPPAAPPSRPPAPHEEVTRHQPGPGGPGPGPGPGATPPRRTSRPVIAVVALVVVVLLAAGAVAAALVLGDDGSDTAGSPTSPSASTPGSSSSSTSATTETTTAAPSTTAAPAAVWEAAEAPSAEHQTLLDNAATMFATADTCRPVDDGEADPLNIYPQGNDEASIECRYGDAATIVFSLFPDDATMSSFFADRLASRDLARGSGAIGPSPPWQLDYADDADRGTGSIFGTPRSAAASEGSEIGFIRTGLRTYAYSFSVGTDFPTFYQWWSDIFGGPAPPA